MKISGVSSSGPVLDALRKFASNEVFEIKQNLELIQSTAENLKAEAQKPQQQQNANTLSQYMRRCCLYAAKVVAQLEAIKKNYYSKIGVRSGINPFMQNSSISYLASFAGQANQPTGFTSMMQADPEEFNRILGSCVSMADNIFSTWPALEKELRELLSS